MLIIEFVIWNFKAIPQTSFEGDFEHVWISDIDQYLIWGSTKSEESVCSIQDRPKKKKGLIVVLDF